MKKSPFSLARYKNEFVDIVEKTDQKTLAIWAIDCAKRVLPYFEDKFPEDRRPRTALETLQKWIETGVFSMAVIRKASLDAHAAAREVGEDPSASSGQAISVARACGQAVATAHVPMHAIGSAIYALQAIHRATGSDEEVEKEKKWQQQHLLTLRK